MRCRAIALFLCTVCAATPFKAQADQLLSIEGLALDSQSNVSGFAIDTWDIRVLAVCRIPFGWIMTAGRELSATGHLSGQASGFMLNLSTAQLGELTDLFLIKDPDLSRLKSPTEPPMFAGTITIDRYRGPNEADDGERTIPPTQANITLKPAAACPKPAAGP